MNHTLLALIAVAAVSAALVGVGIFFLAREGRKKRVADRNRVLIIIGICLAVTGSALLGLSIVLMMM